MSRCQLSVVSGFDGGWAATLLNAGVPIPLDSATLDAAVFAHNGPSVLFRPAIGRRLNVVGGIALAVSAAQSASIEPGRYRIQVGMTAGGQRFLGYDGLLEIRANVPQCC